MSDEISNKTLVMLLVAAIVVSLGGTLISLNKLSGLGSGVYGFATSQTGTANLTIESEVAIYANDGLINFGLGVVNGSLAGVTNVRMSSNNTNSYPNGTWDWTSADYFEIENTGNVDVKVNISGEADSWIGAGGDTLFAITDGETSIAATCDNTPITTWTQLDATERVMCANLNSDLANDYLRVSIQVLIPEGVANEYKENTILFEAYE